MAHLGGGFLVKQGANFSAPSRERRGSARLAAHWATAALGPARALLPQVTRFASIALGAAFAVLLGTAGAHGEAVEWQAHDDRAIAEPAVDESSEHLVRDGAWAMTVYQLHKVFHPSFLHREAADVNALDEVPDSTWFTNRHAMHRLSPAALALGPNGAHAPAATGPLVVLSYKPAGMTAGFVVRDAKGDRYVVKFDSAGYPEVPTGAEMVCTKILHALGWNVPENYLVRLDPSRFVVADDAWTRDGAGTKRALTTADVSQLLAGVAWLPDGRVRAVASRWVPGHAKGGFRTLGRRADDPDDVVPHEDRRELRGLRVVAAWINYTDARRGNFLDTFVPDPGSAGGRGHLVHYLLDFSSALGAGNDDWKSPRYGHEYFFDPPRALLRVATFGMVQPAWSKVPLAHPALGYFDADTFDPEEWRTTYPNPLFDAATTRDAFWGAKLVSAFSDADLAVVTRRRRVVGSTGGGGAGGSAAAAPAGDRADVFRCGAHQSHRRLRRLADRRLRGGGGEGQDPSPLSRSRGRERRRAAGRRAVPRARSGRNVDRDDVGRAPRRRAAGRARDRDQSRPGHALEPADAGHGRG